MKIELKHLTPYLPYGLKALAQGEDKKVFDIQGITDLTDVDLHEKDRTVNEQFDIEDVFPILRPLIDLTKEEIDSFSVYPRMALRKNLYSKEILTRLSYYEYEFLIKNHFDIFNIIENNLAIDINTLKL